MSDLTWEYGIRYDKIVPLSLVGAPPKPYPIPGKPANYTNWGTELGEEVSLRWAKECVAHSDTPDDLKRTIVRRLVGPVEEWPGE